MIFLILPVKIMLCSKLHCQKVFELKHISYKILNPEPSTLQALRSGEPEGFGETLNPQPSTLSPKP